MPANITTSSSTPTLFNKESIKQSLIKNSGLDVDTAKAITDKITTQLDKDKKGKKNYTEEDIFQAASKIYNFDIVGKQGGNRAIRDGIDALNDVVNVDYKYENATNFHEGHALVQKEL